MSLEASTFVYFNKCASSLHLLKKYEVTKENDHCDVALIHCVNSLQQFNKANCLCEFAACELSLWLPWVGTWWLRGSFMVPTNLLDYLSSTRTYGSSIIIKTCPKIAPSHLGLLWGASTNLQVGLFFLSWMLHHTL